MSEYIFNILITLIGLLLSGIGSILVFQFSGMREDFKRLSKSVEALNVKIAEIIKDQSWHKEEIKELKERIDSLQ